MRTVIALGGNAIDSEAGATVSGQREQIRAVADTVGTLVERGDEALVTHGNGPQVGRSLERQEEASLPERPLPVLVAETQARTGYLLADELGDHGAGRTATVLTRVTVDPDDPAFANPSKPVGPYYEKSAAAAKSFETTAVTTADGEDAYRRVVPSPRPVDVRESRAIRRLVDGGTTVVCGGGGGIPVVDDSRDDAGQSTPAAERADNVTAVVDKDHTSSLIAATVDADLLVMATDVEYAYRAFGTGDQRPLRDVDVATMRSALADGEFATGSMRPKVEACLDFLGDCGDRAVITKPAHTASAVRGDAGTQIRP